MKSLNHIEKKVQLHLYWKQLLIQSHNSETNTWGFSVPQIHQFWLLTNPLRLKCTSSENNTEFSWILLLSMLSSILVSKKLFFLWIWSEMVAVNKARYLNNILCTVILLNWHATAVFQNNFLIEHAVVSSTTCTFASVIADQSWPTILTFSSTTLSAHLNFSYNAFISFDCRPLATWILHLKLLIAVALLPNW